MESERYGRWTVLSEWEPAYSKRGWRILRELCVCDCGTFKVVKTAALKNSSSTSCGCYSLERLQSSKGNTKHGQHGTKAYRAWKHMKKRCNNPNTEGYHDYGGRGITYDPRWENFSNFLEDMGHPATHDLSLDRKNTNDNYCKENCRWATKIEQSINKRKYKNNTSGRTGVLYKENLGWYCEIKINKKLVRRGYFSSKEEAIREREYLEQMHHGRVRSEDYERRND